MTFPKFFFSFSDFSLCAASVLFLGCVIGCRKNERITIPSFSPGSAAARAIKLYDENGNGTIEGSELLNCGALQMALPRIDEDGNGKLTDAEIKARISVYNSFNFGLSSVPCTILVDGQPLAGAEVRFEPEEFMLGAISPAVGVTDGYGRVAPRKEGAQQYPGMQVGMYRIRLSRKEGGMEMLPAQFNTESKYGVEIAPDIPDQERGITLDLKTR